MAMSQLKMRRGLKQKNITLLLFADVDNQKINRFATALTKRPAL
jgi:hypothetical protein